MNINEVNILALAYLGDSVFELRVREYLIKSKIYKVNNIQTKSLNYVTAKNQCKFINYLLDNNYLYEDEIDIVKRGRNASVYSHPKNTDIVTYKWATACECLFGYLFLLNKNERIDELMKIILEEKI